MKNIKSLLLLTVFSVFTLRAQDFNVGQLPDTAGYRDSDFGRMWTFDDLPLVYWKETYDFIPDEDWVSDVRLSALQFGGGCSASFVSEKGLIMTNHHCGRGGLLSVQKNGEDLLKNGFYAETMEEERRVPNLYVDQLILIEDVTRRVNDFVSNVSSREKKIEAKREIFRQIQDEYSQKTGLTSRIVTLYGGGKYSLYLYKRYNDIRLVFAPEFQIASTGWDWDNFSYPRYELDFAFYRAYGDDGKPVKAEKYFKWSKNGASEGELIFTVGRPGRTERLKTIAQLEYMRDVTYKFNYLFYKEVYQVYSDMFFKYPERESELLNSVMSLGNAKKSFGGTLFNLHNEMLMGRKKNFEKVFREKISSREKLIESYGQIWERLEIITSEKRKLAPAMIAFRIIPNLLPSQYGTAMKVIELAEALKLPSDERKAEYRAENLDSLIAGIFPEKTDPELNLRLLKAQQNLIRHVLSEMDPVYKRFFGMINTDSDLIRLIENSPLSTREGTVKLARSSPDVILNSDDHFIRFILSTRGEQQEFAEKMKKLSEEEELLNALLGEAYFEVFGKIHPPDATSTLRISDGVIAGYEYNGTRAPGITTYHGLYDRYYSFGGRTYPWGLPERYKVISPDLALSTPICFASTNDMVGGNSGSAIINVNREIVGLAHDGNIESLAGAFIYDPAANRAVATDSRGLLAALKYIYKAKNLAEEISEE